MLFILDQEKLYVKVLLGSRVSYFQISLFPLAIFTCPGTIYPANGPELRGKGR